MAFYQVLEFDVKTVTTADYTVDFSIKPEMLEYFEKTYYKSDQENKDVSKMY